MGEKLGMAFLFYGTKNAGRTGIASPDPLISLAECSKAKAQEHFGSQLPKQSYTQRATCQIHTK